MKLLIVNNLASGFRDGAIYDFMRAFASDGDEICVRCTDGNTDLADFLRDAENFDAVGLIPAILSCMLDRAGEFPSRPDAMEVFRCRECTVVADPPLAVQYDGEVTGTMTPFTVRMLPEAARFVVSEECLALYGEESATPLDLD